jgi:hypothetical protein
MLYGKIKSGQTLFNQSDVANSFFIVENGNLEVIVNGKVSLRFKGEKEDY